MTEETYESFLDEEFLRKLEAIKILAQKGLKGPNKGEHHYWRSGASLEFLDYRRYQMGDDFRYVDWNVYGRLDKLFLKLFRSEEDISIHVLVDMSASMSVGNPPKDDYAKKIAAALSYIGLTNMDRVGVTDFAETLGESRAPQRGRQVYLSVLSHLLKLRPAGGTDFNSCMTRFAATVKKPGMAIVISDLLDPNGFKKGLDALTYRKFNTTVVQVLDVNEIQPVLGGYLELKDLETGQSKKVTVDAQLRDLYTRRMNEFLDEIKGYCLDNGIDYYLTNTQIPFEDFLLDYLTKGTLFH